MKLTLINTGNVAVPVVSEDEGGWAEALDVGQTLDLDKPSSDVWVVGEKPGMLDALKGASSMLHALVTAIVGSKPKGVEGVSAMLAVTITNHGDKPIRVIPGDPMKEGPHLVPEESVDVAAKLYIELRELGG